MNGHRRPLRIAIAGIGNCASALIQGLGYYRGDGASVPPGLMNPRIGDWGCGDIDVVAAFDVDERKVGKTLSEAIFAPPNCAHVFWDGPVPGGDLIVLKGPVADGIAPHMADFPADRAFRPSAAAEVDPATVLRHNRVDVLVCYLPVGSDAATRLYANACIEAGCALVNCAPCFIASDPEWAERFRRAGLPVVGDDIKSQLGATIVHRALARLFSDRGIGLRHTYQLNTGGNTDFLNMLARDRLASKKLSKTRSVQSQLDQPVEDWRIHIGPSDYVPWQHDNKVCFLRMEGEGFGGQPIEIELRLSVQDSPNSAGIVVDAVRYAGLARARGLAGPLDGVSAWLMKSPPTQLPDHEAKEAIDRFLAPDPVRTSRPAPD